MLVLVFVLIRISVALVVASALVGCAEAQPTQRVSAADTPSVVWSPSVRLSTGVELARPAIGVASSGAALAAFSESDSYSATTRTVKIAAAAADQPFSTATTFADSASSPALAVAADGQAIITYVRELSPTEREAVVARGNVDGTFSPVVRLGQAEPPRALALAPDGTAVLVTDGFRERKFFVDVRRISAAGRIGAPLILGDVGLSAAGALAVGPDGTIALVFTDSRRSSRPKIRVAVLAPGARELRITTALQGRYATPQIAVGPAGRIAVAATRVEADGEGTSYGGVTIVERKPGARSFGSPVKAPVTPQHRPYAFGPAVAYDTVGHRVVAWIQDADPSDTDGEAEDSRGVAWSWTGTRRSRLDTRTREVTLTGTAAGVLAITGTGPWQAFLITPRSTRRVNGPQGRASDYATSPISDRSVVNSPARVVFGFTGTSPQQTNLAAAAIQP